MNFKEIEPKTLKKLHEVEVEILDEVVRICNKHNLNYFLVGGTLLGAVRHKGFIPWDDDLDIGMVRKDYDKFVEICKTELDPKYILQSSSSCDSWSSFNKVRKKNTLFNEQFISHLQDIDKGIFVDIFPFDYFEKTSKLITKIRSSLIKGTNETVYYKYKCCNNIAELRYKYIVFFLRFFSLKLLKKWQYSLMTHCKNENSSHLICYVGAYAVFKETYDKNEIFPLSTVIFEGKEYNAPKNPDYYLTRVYGDYMVLPPLEKRVNHSVVDIIFDTNEKD